jgi:hypothetical protein
LAILCPAAFTSAQAAASAQRKAIKAKARKAELPPLPSGPTGPVQPMPLDAIAAMPPQVTYENNQLTIVASNSTLADVLRAVRKITGAEIDVPIAPERVVTHLGPGPARDVLADLLNGSRFNYVLLGSPGNETALTRVVLVAKTEGATPNQPAPPQPQPAMGMAQASPGLVPPQENVSPDVNDPAMADDNNNVVDDNAEQQPPPDASEPQANPDQPQVKTPQQMLQEMQQRQMQLQMQQHPEQAPQGSGMPPHPPQEQ